MEKEIFDSWKEIASYLGRDVRTCTRWEKHDGLPVRRRGGKAGSRVIAYKSDLDLWLATHYRKASVKKNSAIRFFSFKKPWLAFFIPIPLFVAAMTLLLWPDKKIPSDFRILNSQLIILDQEHKEIASFDTGLTSLASEDRYRTRFQVKTRLPGAERTLLPLIIIRDLDLDGKTEVLFSPQRQDEKGTDLLYCIGQGGSILWERRTGESQVYGKRRFPADFVVQGFDTADLDNDGKEEIVCISNALHEWPTRISVYSASGKLLGVYWNSGQIVNLLFTDFNQDGKKDILASGINNEYRKGCLIAFDTTKLQGGSPQQNDEYQSKNLPPGNEARYILFPRTEVDLAFSPVDCITELDLLEGNIIRAEATQSMINYEFDNSLRLLEVNPTHGYDTRYLELKRAGIVRFNLDKDYINKIRRGVSIHKNGAWIPLDETQ